MNALDTPPHRRQRGAVLVVSLLFLVVLTLLGLSASRMAILEERMAGNMRDRSIAMQAAEMTLRRAEQHVALGMDINGFDPACAEGLCEWADAAPVWDTYMANATTVAYSTLNVPIGNGNKSLAAGPALPVGLSAAPRYLIEGKYDAVCRDGTGCLVYRITVRSQGVNPNTAVWLQEIVYRD